MKVYIIYGVPYSDELYHYGIKGQKWGIRKYQNEDGTLTALGKIRYGVSTVADAAKTVGGYGYEGMKKIGSAAKTAVKSGVGKVKEKYSWAMSDAELQARINRLEKEKQYNDLLLQRKPQISRGRRIAGQILEEGSKTLARGAFTVLSNKLIENASVDRKSPSYQYLEAFRDSWNDKSGEKPSQAQLDEKVQYIEALRKIEGSNKGKKKGG